MKAMDKLQDITEDAKESLLDALLDIQEEALLLADGMDAFTSYISPESGICFSVEYYLLDDIRWQSWECIDDAMHLLFQSWKGFSGNPAFPVGGEKEYMDIENLWVGESGEKRRDLLNHMISELSK